MKEDVIVTVTGIHRHPGVSGEETTKTVSQGKYRAEKGTHIIEYEEYMDDAAGTGDDFRGGVATYNLVTIRKDAMEVTRKGSVESTLYFKQGVPHDATYKTQFGQMKSHIETTRYAMYEMEKGRRVIAEAEYIVSMNGLAMSETLMRIDITEETG